MEELTLKEKKRLMEISPKTCLTIYYDKDFNPLYTYTTSKEATAVSKIAIFNEVKSVYERLVGTNAENGHKISFIRAGWQYLFTLTQNGWTEQSMPLRQ